MVECEPAVAPAPQVVQERAPAAAEGGLRLQSAIGQSEDVSQGAALPPEGSEPHDAIDPCTGLQLGEVRLIDRLVENIECFIAPWATAREGNLRFETRSLEFAISSFKQHYAEANPERVAISQAPKGLEELKRRLQRGNIPRFINEIRATKNVGEAPALADLVEWLGLEGEVMHTYHLLTHGSLDLSVGAGEAGVARFELRYESTILPNWSRDLGCITVGLGKSVTMKPPRAVRPGAGKAVGEGVSKAAPGGVPENATRDLAHKAAPKQPKGDAADLAPEPRNSLTRTATVPGGSMEAKSFNFIYPDDVHRAVLDYLKVGLSAAGKATELGFIRVHIGRFSLLFNATGNSERAGEGVLDLKAGASMGVGVCATSDAEVEAPKSIEPAVPAPRSAVLTPIRLSVYFDVGSAELSAGNQAALEDLVARLDAITRSAPGAEPQIHLQGVASAEWKGATESAEAHGHNEALAVDRTLAVQSALDTRLDNAGLPARIARSISTEARVGQVEHAPLDREVCIEVSFDMCAPRNEALGEAA